MYPTVAPFPLVQPHHRMPYDSHQIYDANESEPFLNPISRSRIQLPHPVQRLDHRDGSGSSSSANVEHTLRRKTPSGTLAAGYDGTPVDTNQPPPKHILVSPESGQFFSHPGMQENWQILDQTALKQVNFPPVFKNDPAGNAIPSEVVQDANGTSWVRPVNYPPGVDSMLNQSLPLQASQRILLQNGAYVPTVLPATLQSCLGPTASAGTGPFGPYWPNGVYIPYRPAAFRDARFESPTPFTKQLNTGQPFYDLNQPVFNQAQPPIDMHTDGFPWGHSMPNLAPDPLLKPHFPPRHSEQLPFHVRANRPIQTFPPQPFNNEPAWSNRPPAHGFQPLPTVVANAEFKEKALSWAHGVYVDLLATIHQARRNSISNGVADNRSRPIIPAIYPKPPRQPGLDFSQAHPPDLTRHNSYPSSQYDTQRQNLNALGNQKAIDSTHPAPLRVHARRPSLNQFAQNRSDTHMIGMRETGLPGVSPFTRARGSLFNEGTPAANAATALDMLSHLCNESHWEWIDGMLLGGCLAYGLGDYHKATRWYSRIIARDAT
jgi:hypothetical protein